MEKNKEKKPIKVAFVGMGSVGQTALRAALEMVCPKSKDAPDVIVAVDKPSSKGSLQQFAEHLMKKDIKEVQQLAMVLKEEYGIEAAPLEIDVASVGKDIQQVCLSIRRLPKNDYHVPKKIGQVCRKPKGKSRK